MNFNEEVIRVPQREPEYQFPHDAIGEVVSGIVKMQQEIAQLKLQKETQRATIKNLFREREESREETMKCEAKYEAEIENLRAKVKELDHSNKVRELKINELGGRIFELGQMHEEAITKLKKEYSSDIACVEDVGRKLLADQEAIAKNATHVANKRLDELLFLGDEHRKEIARKEKVIRELRKELRDAKKGTPKKKTRTVRKDKGTKKAVLPENP